MVEEIYKVKLQLQIREIKMILEIIGFLLLAAGIFFGIKFALKKLKKNREKLNEEIETELKKRKII